MRPLRSLSLRVVRAVAVAAAPAALLLGACRDAVAQTAPMAPAAQPVLTSSGWDTRHVGGRASYGLSAGAPGTAARFVTGGGASRTTVNEGAGDSDPAAGYGRAAMPGALAHAAYARVTPEDLPGETASQGKSTIGNIR
jgi:hypothetical protein